MISNSERMDNYWRKREQQKLDPQLFIATLQGVKTPEQILLEKERLARLEHFIDRLQPRTGLAVRLRYGIRSEPRTFEQVGEIFGVTRERIRQIIAKGERILRRWILREENPRRLREIEQGKAEKELSGIFARQAEWARKQEADWAQRDIEEKARVAQAAEYYRKQRLAREQARLEAFERCIAPGFYERARDDFYRRQRLLTEQS